MSVSKVRKLKKIAETPGSGFQYVEYPKGVNPELRDDLVFTIPLTILNGLVAKIPKDEFDSGALRDEYCLAESCAGATNHIGYWRGQPIFCTWLHRQAPIKVTEEDVEMLRWGGTAAKWNKSLSRLNPLSLWVNDCLRGYCGWLMTNPTFREEHDALFETWQARVSEYGIPNSPIVKPGPGKLPNGYKECDDDELKAFYDAFEDFFRRWRLNRLIAPEVPEPIGPHLAPLSEFEALRRIHMGGALFHLPDIFPIPSRDELRNVLDDGRAGDTPEHLVEWATIIRSGNKGKKELYAFGRLFELQHLWRALHQRHGKALCGAGTVLRSVLARPLGVSPETLRRDLVEIKKRLGPDWYPRP
jgi:hypothetical protein